MAKLEIVKYGQPILQQKCKSVEKIDACIKKLIVDMFNTMYAAPGVGLAANQVGVHLRLCVIDVRPNDKSKPIVLINPNIVDGKGKIEAEEGCLSFPSIAIIVKRFEIVKVDAINERGMPITITAEGMLGRAMQHEIDHLNGKVFLDYLSSTQKQIIKRQIKEKKKAGEW